MRDRGGRSRGTGQVTATFEGGISAVRYDGFLTSAAAALTPAVQWQHPRGRGFLSARGTYLQFESATAASTDRRWLVVHPARAPLARRARRIRRCQRLRQHRELQPRRRRGADSSHGRRQRGLARRHGRARFIRRRCSTRDRSWRWDCGYFTARSRCSPQPTARALAITAYSDLRSTARWRRARMLLRGTVCARVWSRGGGRGVYGEGTATWTLGRRTALLVIRRSLSHRCRQRQHLRDATSPPRCASAPCRRHSRAACPQHQRSRRQLG